jgi:glycosyltransferase A (GT-A) superfamily protein (DUF2064 family)
MHTIDDEHTSQRSDARERSQRRVIESVELSDHLAGERVIAAVRSRLADGSHRVVVTSADSVLSADTLEHAFDVLRFSRLVCAPDTSGDIALIGMSQSHDALFASIPWGTEETLDALLRAARDNHLPMVILPPVADGRAD